MFELQETPGWRALGMLIDQNSRDLMDERFSLESEVVSWFKTLDLFHKTENERMVQREPTVEDKSLHRTRLARLIGEGEGLAVTIRDRGGLGENASGIKLEDVEAAIEELRISQREWHEPLNEARNAELWQGIFHVTPPGS